MWRGPVARQHSCDFLSNLPCVANQRGEFVPHFVRPIGHIPTQLAHSAGHAKLLPNDQFRHPDPPLSDIMMLERRLEPEVMDTSEDAHDYDTMDHSTVNRVFVDDFLTSVRVTGFDSRIADLRPRLQVLDVGTGTAQIPIELCHRQRHYHVTAIDLAAEMLKLADVNIAQAGLQSRIRTERIDAKQMLYPCDTFDVVISNSIVHHIPNPISVLSEMIRVLHARGVLFIRDLLRPNSLTEVNALVTTYAGGENAHSQQLFRDSLQAALTLEEVRLLAEACGIESAAVTQTSDRHWTLAWSKSTSPSGLPR